LTHPKRIKVPQSVTEHIWTVIWHFQASAGWGGPGVELTVIVLIVGAIRKHYKDRRSAEIEKYVQKKFMREYFSKESVNKRIMRKLMGKGDENE
jgi:hypothetical protein